MAPLTAPLTVRCDRSGDPAWLRMDGRRRQVRSVVARWRITTGWWSIPVDRDYWRCLLDGGECIELCRDVDGERWWLSRRYD